MSDVRLPVCQTPLASLVSDDVLTSTATQYSPQSSLAQLRLTTCEGWACLLPVQLLPLSMALVTVPQISLIKGNPQQRWVVMEKRKTANIVEYCCISSVSQLPRMFIPFRDRRALSDPNAVQKVIVCPGIHSKLPPPPHLMCPQRAGRHDSVVDCIYEDRRQMATQNKADGVV